MKVRVWEEKVVIPTYGIGKPEKNPVFLEKRVYQGSSGVVYPYPVIEKILDEKKDKEYIGLYLENDYLKIMILPELGGRVQMAFDKTMNRHFIYYNEVIKPALVGLTGPWISGGIEFNWPQHHRPNTYGPVDYNIEENKDGSMTVWVSELERMSRTKMMAGFTLHPGKAYLEIRVRLFNRTSLAQTFLWWANPAVKVNDDYQTVFPPDVNAVFDHGKRDVSKFPIATGTYYKVDYSAGVDISRYKNIPVPTSYMAIHSEYDFMGGYEHDTHGGVLHIANHHVSPGKKQWTWGNGDFGQAWGRNLTDENGPYIELMAGVFTDNQPDFSWLQPYEERTFEQYFLPYKDLGLVKNASIDAAVNIEIADGVARFGIYVTSEFKAAGIVLYKKGIEIYQKVVDLSPVETFWDTVKVDCGFSEIKIVLMDSNGKTLVSYQPKENISDEIPAPATPAKAPEDIDSIEQLYLTGLHLEQYRHATLEPTQYYKEALAREPGNVQNNNALGLWFLKRGQFGQAEKHFRSAISTLTTRNPNPNDGEPLFNLGLTLEYQGKFEEAYDYFYKASWNEAWQSSSFFHLARLSARNKDFITALSLVEKSLIKNWTNHKARHLKTLILRLLGRIEEASQIVEDSLLLDCFNLSIRYEMFLLADTTNSEGKAEKILNGFMEVFRDDEHSYIEYAIDYAWAGQYEHAFGLLNLVATRKGEVYPMVHYFMGYFAFLSGNNEKSIKFFELASRDNPAMCFPNRLEEILVLQLAGKLNPKDSKAPYYLGNLWYDKRQFSNAIECWESSVEIDEAFPTVHRNLALAYFNKLKNPTKALESLEKAFSLDNTDARVLMELDQLYKKLHLPIAKRLALLDKHPQLVNDRDDLYLERISLLNWSLRFDESLKLIQNRKFHPWEGGEGKVVDQYKNCLIELARENILHGKPEFAQKLLQDCKIYPHNLGEGKLSGTQENDIDFLLGIVFSKMDLKELANEYFVKASKGLSEPSAALFYNDQQPDKIFYQGMAWLIIGNLDEAHKRFKRLVDYGKKHLSDDVKLDYFAVSLPDLLIFEDDLNLRNRIHCNYMIGLGMFGLGQYKEAETNFDTILTMEPYHWGAMLHRRLLETDFFNKTMDAELSYIDK